MGIDNYICENCKDWVDECSFNLLDLSNYSKKKHIKMIKKRIQNIKDTQYNKFPCWYECSKCHNYICYNCSPKLDKFEHEDQFIDAIKNLKCNFCKEHTRKKLIKKKWKKFKKYYNEYDLKDNSDLFDEIESLF